ncbi:hypothetical protein HWV62_38957 [Athelia sp. TMB]|nr:hypothetical protein HWV62_38957 [Athelia sp. TMB]
MSNPYAPTESPNLVWMERAILIGDSLSLIAYGIMFMMFLQCCILLGTQKARERGRYSWALAVYILVMFSLGTIFVGVTLHGLQQGLIDYRNFPGGPVAFWSAQYALPLTVLANACATISSWLADALLRWVIAFPILMYLADMSMGTMMLWQACRPNSTLWTAHTLDWGMAYFTIMISLNVFLTTLISLRILYHRRQVIKACPGAEEHAAPYTSIVALLVESSALLAVFGLLFLGPYAKGSHISNIFLPILTQVQIIAPLLIIKRVMERRAWTTETANQTLSALSFNSRNHMPGSSERDSDAGNDQVGSHISQGMVFSPVKKIDSQSRDESFSSSNV